MLAIVWIILFVCAAIVALISTYTYRLRRKAREATETLYRAAHRAAEIPASQSVAGQWSQYPFGDVFALHPLRSVDPVCNTMVNLQNAKASLTRNGRTYLFCSEACLAQFEVNPAAYTGMAAHGHGISFHALREKRIRAAMRALDERNHHDRYI